MKRTIFLLILSVSAYADNSVKTLSNFGGLDLYSKGAMNLSSMIFSQDCKRQLTESDIRKISNTEGFNNLRLQLESGHSVGFREARSLLGDDIKNICGK
ncbi:hypothetical protein [Dickeya sp. NCPPB 3274]|uniref:hypothetical protein n=1 Tax=Dickeya sp. NCPPB 3274 TaxID=568766 RepID=UPI00126793B9|nr:hypothetical protein [Dickeya sp. NCPPB 3274]